MEEQDAVACEYAVRFAVIDRDPVRIKLGNGIRRARIERRDFVLRRFPGVAEQFRGRGLVELCAVQFDVELSVKEALAEVEEIDRFL